MTPLATSDQVRAIQAARRRHGLADDDAYRAVLAESFGVVSTKALTVDQAASFLDGLNGGRKTVLRPAHQQATGPYGRKLQALWIAAHNLGVVAARDDTALIAFAKRQAKVEHTKFLHDPKLAALVIEGLKAMLERGGVRWPKRPGKGAIELKRAIVAALHARLAEHGLYPEFGPFAHLDGEQLDALANRLGALLRRAVAAGSGAAS